MIQLGGNIELVGFKELDSDRIIVVKKIVGNYARKMTDNSENFEKLTVSMRSVHNSKIEIKGKLATSGKVYNSEITDFNLFFALDRVLGTILSGMD